MTDDTGRLPKDAEEEERWEQRRAQDGFAGASVPAGPEEIEEVSDDLIFELVEGASVPAVDAPAVKSAASEGAAIAAETGAEEAEEESEAELELEARSAPKAAPRPPAELDLEARSEPGSRPEPLARLARTPRPAPLREPAPHREQLPHAEPEEPAPQAPARRSGVPIALVLLLVAGAFAGGFYVGGHWKDWNVVVTFGRPEAEAGHPPAPPPSSRPRPQSEARSEEPAAEVAAPVDAGEQKGAKTGGAAKPARPPARERAAPSPAAGGKGTLDVKAPDDAEVFLDGRRVGRGSLRIDVAPGRHRIEVRRGGARVAERFELAPGETWTYEITPTP